jgi:hypothetical protein
MACRPGKLGRKAIAAFAILVSAEVANAQALPPTSEARFEWAIGAASDRFTGAFSFSNHHGIALNQRIRIGYGVRYSFFTGNDLRFRTSDRDDLNGAPTEHAVVGKPVIHALNLVVHASSRILGRAELGFNIDVIGVGFGPDRRLVPEGAMSPAQQGSPTSLNLLRGSARDRGTLNSEFYLGWLLTDHFLLRGGLSHFVAEYGTDEAFPGGSTRLRVDGNLPFIALGYRF